MKIVSFSCEGVHGYLSFHTKFNDSLTFLTGINGSGKTTTVRSIIALLTPSIRELANTSYKFLSVTISNNGEEMTITSIRTEENVILRCSIVEGAIMFPVLKSEAYESRGRFIEREHDFYREQEAMNSTHSVLTAIESLPTPMFLDLERRQQIGSRRRRDEVLMGVGMPANPLAGSLIDSLIGAQKLAEGAYRHALSKRSLLTDVLKQNIILAAFDLSDNSDTQTRDSFSPTWTSTQIDEIEYVVLRSLKQIEINDDRIGTIVFPFFTRVRDVVKDFPNAKELEKLYKQGETLDYEIFMRLSNWSAIQPQVRQINRLKNLIEDYNMRVKEVFDPIERYKNSVNSFLEDSRKTISFSPDGALFIKIDDYNTPQPLEALSSGERQLVVILTHLAFNSQAQKANILIIDEPELSLHLRWQELFVDAVIGASPDLQIILATHSPSIIKARVNYCVDVQEAHSL